MAVVGAGMAGLTAARQLARASNEVRVFDKARGAGGRSSTRRNESSAFDHGAQYFTCRTPDFAQQLEEWRLRGVVAAWGAPIHRLGGAESRDGTTDCARYVGVPKMSALARDLSAELEVDCGQRIASIEPASGCWDLIPEDGPSIRGFDAVVVATPAPQAVPLLAALPRFAERVASVEMQPCHAVMLTLPRTLGVEFGGAFVSDSPLAWLARNASKPGRSSGECWVLHASSEWSAQHLDDDPEFIVQSLIEAFEAALGQVIPTPSFTSVHCWRLARAAKPLGISHLWDAGSCIGVCGDWMIGARVEDAFTSGLELARAMLD